MADSSTIIDDVGGRKFIISLLIVLAATVLCWFGKVNEGVYSTVIIAIATLYIGGNVYQHINTPVGTNTSTQVSK